MKKKLLGLLAALAVTTTGISMGVAPTEASAQYQRYDRDHHDRYRDQRRGYRDHRGYRRNRHHRDYRHDRRRDRDHDRRRNHRY